MHIKIEFDVTPDHAEHANRLVQKLGGSFEKNPVGNFTAKIDVLLQDDYDHNVVYLTELLHWWVSPIEKRRQNERDTRDDVHG